RGLDGPRTRLVVRWRMRFLGWQSRNPVASLIQLALDPMEFIMERKMLLGIRARAEVWSQGRGVPRAAIS
ncbi:MAG TPA: hypothetical protein VGA61_12165, partial [Anaerolineae bacterium]